MNTIATKRFTQALQETIYDSCSLNELDNCIQAMLGWIKEINSFKNDQASNKYSYILLTMGLHKSNLQKQIKDIVMIKCVLKQTGFKNMGSLRNSLEANEIPQNRWVDFVYKKDGNTQVSQWIDKLLNRR